MFAFNIVINFFAIQAFTKKYDDFKILVCIMFFENLGECREILVYLCNKLYEFNFPDSESGSKLTVRGHDK